MFIIWIVDKKMEDWESSVKEISPAGGLQRRMQKQEEEENARRKEWGRC